jgi:hypothetical protein
MKSTDKQYIQKQIDKLQKKRDKSTDTFDIVRLATKISRLKEDLDFFSDERFSKDGNRKFCKHMYFTTAEAGVLCKHKEANYLMCHVANFRGCDYFEEEVKK